VDLLEFQGKQFFAQFGIPVSSGGAAQTVDEAVAIADRVGYPVVVKAQVHVGGRGKAGGIKLANNTAEARGHAANILGMDIKGHIVKTVWIEHASDISEEYYASFTLDRQPTSITTVVHNLTTELATGFTEAGLILRTDLAEMTINGDAVRLRQIVTNLLTNALKFVPPGGTITVTLRRDGDWAEMEIADTGPGISPDELPHVFDRFFRGAAPRAGGSGIGLAVVAELVVAHAGTVSADSQLGHGTTFTVRLPVAPAVEAARQ